AIAAPSLSPRWALSTSSASLKCLASEYFSNFVRSHTSVVLACDKTVGFTEVRSTTLIACLIFCKANCGLPIAPRISPYNLVNDSCLLFQHASAKLCAFSARLSVATHLGDVVEVVADERPPPQRPHPHPPHCPCRVGDQVSLPRP